MTFQPVVGVTPARGGLYGWLTPAVAAIAAHDASFAARLLYMPRAEQHFIAFVLALMGEKASDVDHVVSFARNYSVLSRKTLVAAYGPDANPALLKLVPKFAGKPWRASTYRRLALLFEDRQARKTLRHLEAITRRTVITLSRLPENFRTETVLDELYQPNNLPELVFAITLVRNIRKDLDDRRILRSLEDSTHCEPRDWVMRHFQRVPFPAAPTEKLVLGDRMLEPLCDFNALSKAAIEFDNCIRSYLWHVQKGDRYFYRYAKMSNNVGVAIIELRRLPVAGWVIHEALGPKNNSINGRERLAVIGAFEAHGVGAAPQARCPNGPWFDLG
ncbi:MAG: hypothetical protein AAGJ73_15095 [Pseudomonadota bacterium]